MFLAFTLLSLPAMAQSPVAIRVKARARRLHPTETLVARYTDDRRHSLYYLSSNRLYRYDAMDGKSVEVNFSQGGYDRILHAWLSNNGNMIFVAVDQSSFSDFPLLDGQVVWRINSFTGKSDQVGTGVHVELKKNGCFLITRYSETKDARSPHPKYYVEDFWFYDDGTPLWRKDKRLWKG